MIAGRIRGAYLGRVVVGRFLLLLAVLAMMFTPLGMAGAPAAIAQPAVTASATHHGASAGEPVHCAEPAGDGQAEDENSRKGDCLSDCAVSCSAIPPLADFFTDPAMPTPLAHLQPLVDGMQGLNPESLDPPPRTA